MQRLPAMATFFLPSVTSKCCNTLASPISSAQLGYLTDEENPRATRRTDDVLNLLGRKPLADLVLDIIHHAVDDVVRTYLHLLALGQLLHLDWGVHVEAVDNAYSKTTKFIID